MSEYNALFQIERLLDEPFVRVLLGEGIALAVAIAGYFIF